MDAESSYVKRLTEAVKRVNEEKKKLADEMGCAVEEYFSSWPEPKQILDERWRGYRSFVEPLFRPPIEEQIQRMTLLPTQSKTAEERLKELLDQQYQTENRIRILSVGSIEPEYRGQVPCINNQLRFLDGGIEVMVEQPDPFTYIDGLKYIFDGCIFVPHHVQHSDSHHSGYYYYEFDIPGLKEEDVEILAKAVLLQKSKDIQLLYQWGILLKGFVFPECTWKQKRYKRYSGGCYDASD